MTLHRHWPVDGSSRGTESYRQSRTQGEAEKRNVQWTFRRPNADIARAVSLGRRGM
jgi:uncharacterized protein (DUF427 family)